MEHKTEVIAFGPFRLLPARSNCGRTQSASRFGRCPAVLAYLAQHPERVVSTEELRQAVWGSTYVSRTVVPVCIRELRQALHDEMAAPHYIETIGRQGYRFIATALPPSITPPVISSQLSVFSTDKTGEKIPQLATANWQLPTHFVGRERELAQLQQWFAHAQQGHRQVVFVSGEPGIGKTTLVRQFVADPHATFPIWLGHGQCVGPYGPGEAYLPLLEALGRLSRELGVGRLKAVLLQHAPMWLAQLPSLTESDRTSRITTASGWSDAGAHAAGTCVKPWRC